jgi:L-alanine-DL-glutamate epimerase-like enolase superfamily enzyme
MMQGAKVTKSSVSVYTIPTDTPEADGTFSWSSTTMVVVQLEAGGRCGLGYTYADLSTAKLAEKLLDEVVLGQDAFDQGAVWQSMLRMIRNLGGVGIGMMAISAIDVALWDLRSRLLDTPLVNLIGRVRDSIPVYGSGGFTSYTDDQLTKQFEEWAEQGFAMMKMKVGTHPASDPHRVSIARRAIGNSAKLFVDANGAYTVSQAILLAQIFNEEAVSWFEEPVSSDNLVGLNQVRSRVPAGMDVAAGEYGYTAWYFQQMLNAQAVTTLQADATRCGGVSGFLEVASLCWAQNIPLSSHCGPSVHLHVCCAVPRAIHMEFFHDHARIERTFFEGFCKPVSGCMSPDLSRPGMGLELKVKDAEPYRV